MTAPLGAAFDGVIQRGVVDAARLALHLQRRCGLTRRPRARVRRLRQRMTLVSVLCAGLAVSSAAAADDHLRGVISGRGTDGTVTLQTDDSRTVSVVLADSTKIRRAFGQRMIRMSSASLTPG